VKVGKYPASGADSRTRRETGEGEARSASSEAEGGESRSGSGRRDIRRKEAPRKIEGGGKIVGREGGIEAGGRSRAVIDRTHG